MCGECEGLLKRREEAVEQRSQPPLLVQMYDRLKSLMTEAGKVFPSYCRMAQSLKSDTLPFLSSPFLTRVE